jgi:tetratricopeptide (TPR) repeat protein
MDLAAMSDDPEAWLEQLLSDDLDMDVEMEPPPIRPSEDALFVTGDAPEAAEDVADIPEDEAVDSLFDDVIPEEVPDDPDAAVAWLDHLVSVEPQEPVELEENDEAAEFSLEDDPEAWLEQMLGDEMLDIDMEPPPIKPSEDAVYVTEDDAPKVESKPDLEADVELDEVAEVSDTAVEVEADDAFDFGDMEDDPEAWLEQLLSSDLDMDVEMEPPPIKPSEDAMFVTDDAPAAADSKSPEAEVESEDDIIADVPDDPDEAMVWLEQLAARQGADLEELPSVTDAEAEAEMPSWMAEDLEELAAEPDLDLAEPVDENEADEETAVSLDTAEIAAEDEDIDAELPDWLDEEPRGRELGQTDWLRALPEVDVDTWLSAEEEATITSSTEEIILPDTGPLTSRLQTTSDEEEIDEDILFEPMMEPSTGAYSVDEAKLGVAQEALADGRIDQAISQFKELVAAGSGMMSIIAELEQAAEAHPQAPVLSQVLGDAYMRNGQLQKALASYRAALDQM